jgi:hypothetical protein
VSKRVNFLLLLAGWLVLIAAHAFLLAQVPGLHYDEAWAMNFASRIAFEKGFWPLTAMSPYTAPWTHYWAALWLHAFGPSVFVFRASQAVLSLGGLFLASLALPKHVRKVFPLCCLLLPGLWLNHHFAIELTGFHVLCFGALLYGLRERWFGFAAAAALLGATAHILFYGVALALLGTVLLERIPLGKRARVGALVFFSLMALYFVRVAMLIPEKGKAGALLLSSVAACALLAAHAERWGIWRAPVWKRLLGLASLAFLFNLLFFGQGLWTATIYTGFDLWPNLHGVGLASFLVQWMVVAGACLAALLHARREVRTAFLAMCVVMGTMMLKPAPRYFELLLVAQAALLALWAGNALEWFERPRALPRLALQVMFLLFLTNGAVLCMQKLGNATELGIFDNDLHFLAFKDSARDFIDKQSLARFLGGSGCRPGDIRTGDPRLMEELAALALGDWPVNRNAVCPFASVARARDEGVTGESFGEFVLKGK